jgi:CheY-like chemotaxis protein
MTPVTQQSDPLRVLVVEDKPINRQVLGLILETVNARTTFAENGVEGVDAYRREPFDVVLMDLRMPIMDGYEATREIRAVEASRQAARTPVIVVSAHTRPHEIQAARQAGADLHLGKPVNVPALLGAIQGVAAFA